MAWSTLGLQVSAALGLRRGLTRYWEAPCSRGTQKSSWGPDIRAGVRRGLKTPELRGSAWSEGMRQSC